MTADPIVTAAAATMARDALWRDPPPPAAGCHRRPGLPAPPAGRDPCRPAFRQENAQEGHVAPMTARDGTCTAHHCDPADCRGRTHVVTVRLTGTLWDQVAAKAAARKIDTNAGAVQALEAWAREGQ